jgi:hypothetical protein
MSRLAARAGMARARPSHASPSWRLFAPAGLLLGAVIAACTGTAPSTTPGGSFNPLATFGLLGSGETPAATRWPATVVEAVVALGAADQDFGKAGNDLNDAVQAGDLGALLRASNDTKAFLEGNQKNIPALQSYPPLKPLGDALAPAYAQMLAGVTQIHDSLVSGNSAGVTSGFQQFVAGSTAYGEARAQLADAAEQALFMKKGLLR